MTVDYTEKTLASELIYDGRVFKVIKDSVELSDGSKKVREVVQHPGGVVVAAITEDNRIFLVRQYRYPAQEELYELPAGKLEPGEDPDEAIKRELEEECGFVAKKWQKLTWAFSTPGFCNEKLHLYKATDLVKTEACPDEGELLDSFTVTIDQAWQWVQEGKIRDLKSVALLGLICVESRKTSISS